MSKVYQIVTDEILTMLDAGVVPWQKPWTSVGGNALPRNAWNKPYRGINVFLLNAARQMKGFKSNFWVTYKQAAKEGGQVRKGQKGQMVIFWNVGKPVQKVDEETGKVKMTRPFMLRYFTVFNIDQIDGMKMTGAMKAENDAITSALGSDLVTGNFDDAEAILSTYLCREDAPAYDESGSAAAFYVPSEDRIQVPARAQYGTPEEFFGTTFHEFVHSTGHDSRLKRGKGNAFGSHEYGKEELVAEFGSAMLMGEAGITSTVKNSAAYINGWKTQIKADPKLVVQAAAAAQKAADYVLGSEYKADDAE